jgi:signal transduction histidine kinase
VVATTGRHPFQPGTNWSLDGPGLVAQVRDGGPARIDDYADVAGSLGETGHRAGFHAGVGAPIVVDGEIWGAVAVATYRREPVPADAETRLSQFTALVATAISNTQAREDLRRLADEQEALRRLATLVAEGAEPPVVFDAVCQETGRVLGASSINLARFMSDGFSITVAGWSLRDVHVPAGTRLPLDGESINRIVRDTAAPGRLDSYEHAPGALAELIRRLGIRSEVGAPVVVDGKVWGALIAATEEREPLPRGTEDRLASFAELIATSVANADARAELVGSRVRLVEAADEQRRRIVRDLHDGAQQRLVHTVVTLKLVRHELGKGMPAAGLLEEALDHAQQATEELRELAHGILPAPLTRGGLRTGLDALAARASVPVTLEVPATRFPPSVEATVYFTVAEALTNVSKHARAHAAWVKASVVGGSLNVQVRDDGVGGARSDGTGLVGLRDRLAALDGRLRVDSPPGGGTALVAEIPLPD